MIINSVFILFIIAPLIPGLVRINRRMSRWVVPLLPLSVFLLFIFHLADIQQGKPGFQTINWIPSLGIQLSFYIDGLGLLFALIISGVGFLVFVYSSGYMKDHPYLGRFYFYMLGFMASMLGIVLSDNLFGLFVFWELTSISSYLLIGFEHEQEKSRWAALQALLITGIGGLAMMAGFILLSQITGTTGIQAITEQSELVRNHSAYIPVLLLILLGAFTKSAQVPFHFWLPGAMVAPTPVSTFLHSATMVKAGIYLLARFSPVMDGTGLWHGILVIVGGITTVSGAVLAWPQRDLKRLLAYSTVSALGALTMLLGLGTPTAVKAAALYLLIHALYKSGLFMSAGILDHKTGTRNITQLRGLRKRLPFTTIGAGLAALSMAGVPPFLGYYGKELMYDTGMVWRGWVWAVIIALVVANAINIVVAILCGFKPFWGRSPKDKQITHRTPVSMWFGPVAAGIVGLWMGLAPIPGIKFIFEPAVNIIKSMKSEIALELFHGFTPILQLSLFTLALGGFLAILTRYRNHVTFFNKLKMTFPSFVFKKTLFGLIDVANVITKHIQNGLLRSYVHIIFLAAFVLIGFRLFSFEIYVPKLFHDVRLHEWALAVLMVVAAVASVLTRYRLAAVFFLGVVGYGVALVYIFFGAPDLAITQVLVETLIIILFSLIIYHLPRFQTFSPPHSRWRDFALALVGGGVMTMLILKALALQFHPSISDYFIQNSLKRGHGRNVVNVILTNFRALNTFGEVIVLSVAAIGVFALLKYTIKDRRTDV